MKLTSPTDFEILDSLSDGRRNVASNLAYRLDKDRAYLNTRLPILSDYGLVERIGPAPSSGLYEITGLGELAVEHREQYKKEKSDFETFLEGKRSTQS